MHKKIFDFTFVLLCIVYDFTTACKKFRENQFLLRFDRVDEKLQMLLKIMSLQVLPYL